MLIPRTTLLFYAQNTLEEITTMKQEREPLAKRTTALLSEIVTDWNYELTWSNLTNVGSLTLPRDIYVEDIDTGKSVPLYRKNKNRVIIGPLEGGAWDFLYGISPSDALKQAAPSDDIQKYEKRTLEREDLELDSRPVFRRGDLVVINHNYDYYQERLIDGVIDNTLMSTPVQTFFGYITNVSGDFNINITFSDSMFLLKQYGMDNITYTYDKKDKNPLKTLIQRILDKVNKDYSFSPEAFQYLKLNMLGTSITWDNYNLYLSYETVAQFFERLKKDFNLQIYFIGNILHVGYLISYDQDKTYLDEKNKTGRSPLFDNIYKPVFNFQDNIISSNLTYQRKEDILLAAVSEGAVIVDSKTNFDKKGKPKKIKKKLVVYSTYNSSGVLKSWSIDKDLPVNINDKGNLHAVPVQTSGEKRTFFFPQAETIPELIELSEEQLKKFHYDGFSGSFTTFGSPYVDFNTIIELKNNMQPEQDGFYRVKSVKYSSGVDGYRQEIELFYRFKIDEVNRINI